MPRWLGPLGVMLVVGQGLALSSDVAAGRHVARFSDVADRVGLLFRHDAGASGAYRLPEIMGSGAALLDCDGDGDLDVFFPQASPGAALASRLFRNDLGAGGQWRFVDVTEAAGVGRRGWAMGAAVGDYDNDGDPDLYVTAFGPNTLYRNDGACRFADVTAQAGVDDARWNASAVFLDHDADGDLDLFVTAYVDFSEPGNKPCYEPGGQRDYCLPAEFRPLPARLFRNEGGGRFSDVSVASGIAAAAGRGLGAAVADVNGDGRLDLYVANDGTPNHLWVNAGSGRFIEDGLLAGAAFDGGGRVKAGMGVAAADVDGDGDEDLFVTNLVGEGATLFINDGRGRFEDATARWGLAGVTRPFTGFGTGWFDVDRDGRLDLFLANGAVAIVDALRGAPYPYPQRNLLLLQDAPSGYRDVTAEAGPALTVSDVSRGAAFGDLDNDGRVDVVVSNNNGPVRMLINEAPGGHWLSARLVGTRGVRDGQGALVRVFRPGAPPIVRRAGTGGSYLSASDVRVHVGLGTADRVDRLVVDWPSGEREIFEAPAVDRIVTLRQGSGRSSEDRAPQAAHAGRQGA